MSSPTSNQPTSGVGFGKRRRKAQRCSLGPLFSGMAKRSQARAAQPVLDLESPRKEGWGLDSSEGLASLARHSAAVSIFPQAS